MSNSNCPDYCSRRETQNFENVWQRVLPELDVPIPAVSRKTKENFSDEVFLCTAMDKCCSDARALYALARRYVFSEVGAACRNLASQEREQFRKLHTTYFILTGEDYTPQISDFRISTPLGALRELCLEEAEDSIMYAEAAEMSHSAKIADLCRDAAKEESRRACTLEALIGRTLSR